MKIGVISDTHDHLEPIKKAVDIFHKHKVEMILHGGDWVSPYTLAFFGGLIDSWDIPRYGVFGNNDGDYRKLIERNNALKRPFMLADVSVCEIEADDKKIALYHGHDTAVLDGLILSDKYNLVCTGHTHVVRNEVIDDVLVLNPGSLSYFSEGKIVKQASVAVYDTVSHTAEIFVL